MSSALWPPLFRDTDRVYSFSVRLYATLVMPYSTSPIAMLCRPDLFAVNFSHIFWSCFYCLPLACQFSSESPFWCLPSVLVFHKRYEMSCSCFTYIICIDLGFGYTLVIIPLCLCWNYIRLWLVCGLVQLFLWSLPFKIYAFVPLGCESWPLSCIYLTMAGGAAW